MSRPALLAVILIVVISREKVSGFGFQLPNETQAEEFYTINEDDLEQLFEINQRGAVYDAVTGKRRYDNYQLVRVNPETDEHLDVLQFLDRGTFAAFKKYFTKGQIISKRLLVSLDSSKK